MTLDNWHLTSVMVSTKTIQFIKQVLTQIESRKVLGTIFKCRWGGLFNVATTDNQM